MVPKDRAKVSVLHGQEPLPDTPSETPTLRTVSMRASATWFLDQRTLPRHETANRFAQDFGRFLNLLIPHIEWLAGGRPEDDVPAKVALAGVGEARRRLAEAESAGLHGEVERVKRLARSVVGLCDHFDALAGVTMCLACDKRIEDGEVLMPYASVSPWRGAGSGRIHARCADAVRRC
ncbi:hypothetical protein K4B79_19915 [Streptomyces lincolnensis]|nr:hypothetical protein [Streptomyces lincolnensis]